MKINLNKQVIEQSCDDELPYLTERSFTSDELVRVEHFVSESVKSKRRRR